MTSSIKSIYLNTDWIAFYKKSKNNDIAFEGPDGVGKTTICNMLKKYGYFVDRVIPPEWEMTPLKAKMISSPCWISSAMYFLSGAIEKNIQTLADKTKTTIYDRSIWSSFVVHYKNNCELLPDLCRLLDMVAPYVNFPKHTIVLDPGFDNTMNRILNKDNESKNMDLSLHPCAESYRKEIEFFLWLKELGIDVTIVDASREVNVLEKEILNIIE